MKKVYVNEKWCLACHLCEYYCAFGQSNAYNMAVALKDVKINPNIKVEEKDKISFAVNCRQCDDPICVKGCITGALTKKDGVISIDQEKCIHCYTCIVCCPYGAISPSTNGAIQKCELCVKNNQGKPMCVQGCPNGAIVFEER